jgi:hypothetical protein
MMRLAHRTHRRPGIGQAAHDVADSGADMREIVGFADAISPSRRISAAFSSIVSTTIGKPGKWRRT